MEKNSMKQFLTNAGLFLSHFCFWILSPTVQCNVEHLHLHLIFSNKDAPCLFYVTQSGLFNSE